MIEFAFVFLIIVIITRNEYSILGVNVNYIKLPQEKDLFIAFVLYRSLIYPIILILFVNGFMASRHLGRRSFFFLLSFSLLLLAEFLSIRLGLIEYIKWNFMFHSLFILFLISTASLSYFYMNYLLKRVI
ncbi:hypothetical protein [Bacillus sp. JJ1764]|uniref:hypothetical protein n=1 Tax=Bacillus sp. JJ1764 TaxID=3122964 RepID=UPI002FFE06DA